ncbi:hypothetical protein [Tenacibaculum finnmarkense]|uniref:hypothetical protein n=1 Tax=Tenacibaculum finnmarkense TaxID=2781243 RepID=UPI001EFA694D|nr:hypothetical protein [Tenacibaculum finnmarkense]MCG8794595.1 hypothetical protein [Tenacibaculum finnmarkense]MCG8796923.1 hypothetical protein [Tenacibaculum finnmarkense]
MKKLSLLIIVILTAFSCNNQKEETDLTKEKLKGRVKSYTEISYKAIERFGKIEKGERLKSIQIKYSNKGNKIETNHYNSYGSLSSKHIYKYGNKGNKIEKSYYNSDGSLSSKHIYKYDNKGNKIEMSYYHSDGILKSKSIYKYDNKGNEIEMRYYVSDDLGFKSISKYDNKGNEVEMRYYDSGGNFDEEYYSKYDNKGNKIEMSSSNAFGKKSKYIYKYDNFDKKGNWTKKITFKNEIPDDILEREFEYFE